VEVPGFSRKDENVKIILPSVGIFGLYLGAWAGALIVRERMELGMALGGILGGGAALLAAQVWLWPVGRFATVSNGIAAWTVGCLLAWFIPWPFLQNLVLWAAVFLSVWREERAARPRPESAARISPPRS
jgi:hypothetical protein